MSKSKPQYETYYVCGAQACAKLPKMDFNAMMEHCEKEHGEVVRGTPVEKEMVCHLDGADFFAYEFKITTATGLTFNQHQYFTRRGR
jgi:hypothetical protein